MSGPSLILRKLATASKAFDVIPTDIQTPLVVWKRALVHRENQCIILLQSNGVLSAVLLDSFFIYCNCYSHSFDTLQDGYDDTSLCMGYTRWVALRYVEQDIIEWMVGMRESNSSFALWFSRNVYRCKPEVFVTAGNLGYLTIIKQTLQNFSIKCFWMKSV